MKLEKLNTFNSEYSISQNLDNTSFFVSYSKDSKTNYDIYEYKSSDSNNSIILTLNFENEINSGSVEISSKNNFYENINIINNYSKIKLKQEGLYDVKITSQSYFILDTLISIDKSQSIDLSLTKIEKGSRIQLSKINFLRASTRVTDESLPYLDNLLHIFSVDNNIKVTIEGHTDSVGDNEANQRLSEARANAVKTYLQNKGVAEDRIVAEGFGETRPVASNDTREGKAKNRRVEFILNY